MIGYLCAMLIGAILGAVFEHGRARRAAEPIIVTPTAEELADMAALARLDPLPSTAFGIAQTNPPHHRSPYARVHHPRPKRNRKKGRPRR